MPASDLKSLVPAKFGKLSDAERLLLEKVSNGEYAMCGPNRNDVDPNNNPKDADNWGPTRQVRADLVGWLCMDENARKHVHWRGIQVYGADITGPLDLSFVNIPFPLTLRHCRLKEAINLEDAEVSQLDLQGSLAGKISANGVVVKNDVSLSHGFTAVGTVRLIGAEIGGNLSCIGGTLTNPPRAGNDDSGTALYADRISVKGLVALRNGFTASGEVRLLNAEIGSLDCSDGTFTNPPQKDVKGSGSALNADGANVKSSVFLNRATASGEVRLVGAQIGGALECSGATFTNFLQKDLPGSGAALLAERINVKNNIFLDGFTANGAVVLGDAQIGGLIECVGGNFRQAVLDLINASAGSLTDSGLNDSGSDSGPTIWPQPGRLFLDGFVYGRISSEGRINVTKRLEWLGLQPRPPFRQQPYFQLAKVLQESGDSDGALRVLEKMEELRRSSEEHGPIAHLESWVLKGSIGYGYYPGRAIWEVIGLSALGWIIYRRSYLAGTMAPTDKDAYQDFKARSEAPAHYPAFSPLVYSVENSLPLVKLGQVDKWQPDPEVPAPQNRPAPKLGHRGPWRWAPVTAMWDRMPRWFRNGWTRISAKTTSPRFVLWFLWFQILLGWLLATLFVAGVSGIVHKE